MKNTSCSRKIERFQIPKGSLLVVSYPSLFQKVHFGCFGRLAKPHVEGVVGLGRGGQELLQHRAIDFQRGGDGARCRTQHVSGHHAHELVHHRHEDAAQALLRAAGVGANWGLHIPTTPSLQQVELGFRHAGLGCHRDFSTSSKNEKPRIKGPSGVLVTSSQKPKRAKWCCRLFFRGG